MINPFAILAQKQKQHVERTGESVIYTPYKLPPIILNCSVQDGNFKNANDEFFKDACSFMTLTLDREPMNADTITYDGIIWHVDSHSSPRHFSKIVDGVETHYTNYDVVAYNKSHNPSSKNNWKRGSSR